MNTEEAPHSVVKRDGKTFVEIPQQISSTTRSIQSIFSGNMNTTASGNDNTIYIPVAYLLNFITVGNGNNQRTGETIKIKSFEVCFNISPAYGESSGWQPLNYTDDTMTDFYLYQKNKLVDPRIRIIACNQRRKLSYIPGTRSFPFYEDGDGVGAIKKPIDVKANNSHMVEQLDARSYETHYDDSKNLFNRSSGTPNLTFYQDFQVDSVFEYEDTELTSIRYGDNGLKEKVPDIWLYSPVQYDTQNECQLYFSCSIRVLYDCM